jgi:hypothetical protein
VLRAPSLTADPRPPRITRKSDGPRVPDRTMDATLSAVLLCWFRNRQASLRTSDENRWQRKPKPRGHMAPQPSTWRGSPEQISLDQVGWEARKSPAEGDVFFLDFALYRTSRESEWMEATPSIRRGFLNVIDDDDIHRSCLRLQLESQLLLQGRVD